MDVLAGLIAQLSITIQGIIPVLVSGTSSTKGIMSTDSIACYLNSCGFTLQSYIFSHQYVIPQDGANSRQTLIKNLVWPLPALREPVLSRAL